MQSRMFTVLSLIVVIALPLPGGARPLAVQSPPLSIIAPASAPDRVHIAAALQSVPLMFIENVGQFDDRARFQVRGANDTLIISDDAIWVTVLDRPWIGEVGLPQPASRFQIENPRGVNLKLSFVGANPHPRLEPYNRLNTHVSYFRGNDPTKWRSDVPAWEGVRYRGLYPGIDLELTSLGGRLVPRLIIQPGADLDTVRLRVEGAEALHVEEDTLYLSTAIGEYTLPLLTVIPANDSVVPRSGVSPKVSDAEITDPFAASSIRALSSPVSTANTADLLFSTFLGGNNEDSGRSIDVDSNGSVYVTGYTASSNFPTTLGAFDTTYNSGVTDIFVIKLNTTGSNLVYATFLGGSGIDFGNAIVVDGSGNAYVTGLTDSPDFPTTSSALDTSYNGKLDAFVVKVNPNGAGLVYATFIGGTENDEAYDIDIDGSKAAYITGLTDSSDFPTTPGSLDTTCGTDGNCNSNGTSHHTDAFLVKLNTPGTALDYATFIGGNNDDDGLGIAVISGFAYVTGDTASTDFPTTNGAFDNSYNGGTLDGFIAKLNTTGNGLVYATFLGGSDNECYGYIGCTVAVDTTGAVYVTGRTLSGDFPTTLGAFDTTYNGGFDAFVVKLDPSGSFLTYSTFLGGSGADWGYSIAVDSNGLAYISGATNSTDFPATPSAFDTNYNGNLDAFVVTLNSSGSALAYSTFLGGSDWDGGLGITLSANGTLYVVGETYSSDFPTTPGTYDTSYGGGGDVFVAKLILGGSNPAPTLTGLSPTSATAGGGAFTLTVNGTNFINSSVVRWNGSDRPTTFVSNTQLTATLTAADIATAGTVNVTVFNLAPGGGTSNTQTFTITPPSGATWTLMLYLAGDTGGIDNGLVHSAFGRALQLLEQNPNAQVRVVALIDGPGPIDTFRVTFSPQANYQPLGEKHMDDPATLIEFVQQARQDFPADHYYLVIANHANGVQGIAWDTTSNANKTAFLTPSEIRQALVTITNNGAQPIDVLHFDGCSFGLLEDATLARGLVRYVVASENIGWSVFAYADYRATIGTNTPPADFARAVAQRYAQRVGEQQYPYTISVLDLSRLDSVLTALNTLADGLTNFANVSQSNRTILSNVRVQSQKFDSGGTPSLEITNDDTYVDLMDFAARVKVQVSGFGVPAAADNLIAAIAGSQPFVLYESHLSGSFDYFGDLHIWNLDGAHGVSVYYPPKSAGANYGNYISGATFPTFSSLSHWPAYLQAGVPPLGPGDPLPTDGPDPLAPLPLPYTLYLPLVLK